MHQEMDTEVLWFRSQIDWWIGMILVVLPFVGLSGLISEWRSGDIRSVIALVISMVFIVALYGVFVISIRYGMTRDDLIIQFGVMKRRIRYADISEVRPTKNPLSAPALSLNRLEIRTTRTTFGRILISPFPREEFLAALAVRAGLIRHGERLVRTID
ncbi:MAG TPA: PH domain-containing protein [Firmicutes bacterium]|jgi:hypothetical protein|nr:PH domain-containing protein [Bacillota bacterium]